MATLQNPHRREKPNAGAETGATDLEFSSQLALRRKPVARVNFSTADEGADMFDNLHRKLAMASGLFLRLF